VLSKLAIDLWPEYDRPGMLVIEHLFIDASTPLPVNVTIRIPSSVGNPYNLASRHTDGNLYNLTYNQSTQGDWSDISFSAPTAEIQLEYYDSSIQKSGSERSFTFNWPGGLTIHDTSIQVQQPTGASNLQSTPASGNPVLGENGLSYYTTDLGAINVTQPFSYKVTYQKPDDNLTVQSGQVVPSGPINSTTTGRTPLLNIWYYVLGGIAILLIAGAGFWFLRNMRRSERVSSRKRHIPAPNRSGRRETGASTGSSEAIYCHQCGKRAGPGDIYCRACGAKLRREE
jgi:hypothetical protein